MEERLNRTDEEREYYALNKRVYAAFAPFYDFVTFPIGKLRRQVAAAAGVDARSRVLDVATGTGAQARAFAEKAGEVIGVDLSAAMLRVARRKNRFPNLIFRQADATELPFGDARFDVACISFALHEMPRSIRERTVAEMARVTKPGGTIVVVDYGQPRDAFGNVLYHLVKLYERDHYVDFIRSDLRALLQQAGIEVGDDRAVLLGTVRIVTGSRRVEGEDHGPGHRLPPSPQRGQGAADEGP
jgi:demethylmenaquinone methyltransferase/2-methoxy-6-polyprenyl-1,4-benzoquinol methylase